MTLVIGAPLPGSYNLPKRVRSGPTAARSLEAGAPASGGAPMTRG